MEATNFLTWFIAIAVIAVFGVGSMVWAYKGSGSVAVLFSDPIDPSPLPTGAGAEVADHFQKGVEAFRTGNYRKAIEHWSQAVKLDANLAEAYHNGGLAFANLRQDDEAVISLVKAGDLYLEQGNEEAIALLKQHLEALKARKLAREGRGG